MIKTTPFQLAQWRGAVKLEAKGISVASCSVTAHVKRVFGLSPRTKRPEVLEHLESAIAAVKAAGVPLHAVAELGLS